jgi:hypothetical protein
LGSFDRPALKCENGVAGDDEQPCESGEVRNEILGHPVAEILLLGVAAHVEKGEHGNRALVREQSWGLHLAEYLR